MSNMKSFLLLSTVDMLCIPWTYYRNKILSAIKITISFISIQFYANLDKVYFLKPDMIWLFQSKFTKVVFDASRLVFETRKISWNIE